MLVMIGRVIKKKVFFKLKFSDKVRCKKQKEKGVKKPGGR